MSFAVDWDHASVCIVHKDSSTSEPKGDFDIEITGMVGAGANTGFTAYVKRSIDGKSRFVQLINYMMGVCFS